MTTLQHFDHSCVVMYLNDHPPPHVHVKLRDGRDCTVDLQSLQIKGRVARREIHQALAWIRTRQAFLQDQWQKHQT